MSIDTFLLSADTTDLDYPEVRPTLDLNFARVKALDPRITFTRASGGSYVGADGLIKYAGVNEARFDHNPTTGESLGLLVEEARTNLLTDSAGNFNYGFNNQIIPTANDVAPDGTTVLCKHDLTGVSSPFLNCRANTTLNAGTYTMSMYLKGTTSFSGSFAFVGETNNEIYSNTANITTTWQRFTLTFTLLATSTLSRLQLFFATEGEGKIVSVWGAQLEARSFATTYIARSSGAQATRAADNASITGKNFRDFYRQDEGSFLVNFNNKIHPNSILDMYLVSIFDSSNIGRRMSSRIGGQEAGVFISTMRSFAFLTDFTYTVESLSSNTYTSGNGKSIFNYEDVNYFSQCLNGGNISLDAIGNISQSGFNILVVGRESGTNRYLNGTISRLTYYPKRLSNSQLQALTR